MCLITTKNIPEIAQEDIVCYKFYKLRENKLFSPYKEVLAPNMNEVANTVLDRGYLGRAKDNNLAYMVNRGFHSFKYIDDLTKELYFWQSSDVKIFKCIIPKGTKYYEGKFDESSSYCSESIILKETIDIE